MKFTVLSKMISKISKKVDMRLRLHHFQKKKEDYV